ncbi:uncharacterized protein LOC119687282 [Teleopsis dalmanni]|uniref:uncharacterized protein LOC119662704 n=1 Tax=Teleopsis dalmanni TaxID=139649 RepID=UPI0018CFE663|nr:uncharacterized protein LOC119662704 [Teleopsis dalmanni]XP_037957471.1 uncharacterized protein LOC119687282 [Teleopsis dalmanni]
MKMPQKKKKMPRKLKIIDGPSFLNEDHSNTKTNADLQALESEGEGTPPAKFAKVQTDTSLAKRTQLQLNTLKPIMCEKSVQFDTNRSKEDKYLEIYKQYIKAMNKRQRIVLIQNIFKAIVTTLDDCRDFNDSVIESPQSKKYEENRTVENKSNSVPVIVVRKPIGHSSQPETKLGPGARLATRVPYTVSGKVNGVCGPIYRIIPKNNMVNNAAVTANATSIVNSSVNSSNLITLHASNTNIRTINCAASSCVAKTSTTSAASKLLSQNAISRCRVSAVPSVRLANSRFNKFVPSVSDRVSQYWTKVQTQTSNTMHSKTLTTVSATNTNLNDCKDFNDSVIESPQSKKDDEKTVENKSDSVPVIVVRKPKEHSTGPEAKPRPGFRLVPGVSYTVWQKVKGVNRLIFQIIPKNNIVNNAAVTANAASIVNSPGNSSNLIALHASNTTVNTTANITASTFATTSKSSPYSSVAVIGTLSMVIATPAMAPIQKSALPICTVHANNSRAINNFSPSLLRQNAPQPPSDNNDSDDEFAGIIRADNFLWIKDEPLDDYDL